MRKNNIMFKKGVLLAVTLCLLMTSFATATHIQSNRQTKQQFTIKEINDIMPNQFTVQLSSNEGSLSFISTDRSVNGPGNQTHPAIGRLEGGIQMVAYRHQEDDFDQVIWTYSEDDGETFGVGRYLAGGSGADYPSIQHWADSCFYGTMVPDENDAEGAALYLFKTTDPVEYGTYDLSRWDLSKGGFFNMVDSEIACDNSQNDHEFGIISLVISQYRCCGYPDVFDGPYIAYKDKSDPDLMHLNVYDDFMGCMHTDADIDAITEDSWAVYDWDDEGTIKLVYRKDNFNDLSHQGSIYTVENAEGNIKNPVISAYDDSIVIVAETDEQGNNDIVCFYGNGSYANKLKRVDIAFSSSDEQYPDLRHVEHSVFICSFEKDGVLYKSLSYDNGRTWSEEASFSGEETIVSEYKTADICDAGVRALFQVENENRDIAGEKIYSLRPTSPIIRGSSEGKINVEHEFTFEATDPENENISYYVDWGDGSDVEFFGPFNSGQQAARSHSWSEKGEYVVRAKAQDSYKVESTWATFSVTLPVSHDPNTEYADVSVERIDWEPVTEKLSVAHNAAVSPLVKEGSIPQPLLAGDQLHPALGRSLSGVHLFAYRDEESNKTVWTYSTDDGRTYDDGSVIEGTTGEDYPAIERWDTNRFFATLIPSISDGNAGTFYLLETDDPTDYESYDISRYPLNTLGYHSIRDIEIACDNTQENWRFGVASFISDKNGVNEPGYYNSGVNLPSLIYQTGPDEIVVSTYQEYQNHYHYDQCYHTDVDIDHSWHDVWSIYDTWTKIDGWRLILRQDYFADFSLHGELYFIEGEGNLSYPSIAADNGKLVILAVTTEKDNDDIICYHGNVNHLEVTPIATSLLDESFPDVRHVDGTTFVCTFMRDNILYSSVTHDGGETWSTPEELVDNVPFEYRSSSITDFGLQAVASVKIDNDVDILLEPKLIPRLSDLQCEGDLEFSDIQPGATITGEFVVKNIGEPLSLLAWETENIPTWGNWTILPKNGYTSTLDESKVNVIVELPLRPNVLYEETLRVRNVEDPDDFCDIPISISVPSSQFTPTHPLLQWVHTHLQDFPIFQLFFERLIDRTFTLFNWEGLH